MAVLLQVLDTTIANVALPHMQASLSATQDTINWVLTSYIVASAIALPISGWLADRVGRKRLLLVSVVMFTVASLLCATATSLAEMVATYATGRVGFQMDGSFDLAPSGATTWSNSVMLPTVCPVQSHCKCGWPSRLAKSPNRRYAGRQTIMLPARCERKRTGEAWQIA